MPIDFDPINKLILLPNTPSIAAQEIYNATKDWEANQEGIDNSSPMLGTGFAPLGGGAYTDKIFILVNGWKLKPYSGTYTLTIIGTIITDDESNRMVPPDSGEVQVIFQVTSQGIISVMGSGVTEQDKDDIANLIESQTGQPIKTELANKATQSKVIDVENKVDKVAKEVTANEIQGQVTEVQGQVDKVKGQVTEVQKQVSNIEYHHVGRVKLIGNHLHIYNNKDELIGKYRLVKDSDGRIIERIPEAI